MYCKNTHHLSPFYHFSHSLISFFISITIDNIISTVSFLSHDSHTYTYYRWVRRVRIRGNSTTLPSGSLLTTMCRISWCKEGRKEGREEGRKEGREEGRKGGRKEGAYHDVPSSTVSHPSPLTHTSEFRHAIQCGPHGPHGLECNRLHRAQLETHFTWLLDVCIWYLWCL